MAEGEKTRFRRLERYPKDIRKNTRAKAVFETAVRAGAPVIDSEFVDNALFLSAEQPELEERLATFRRSARKLVAAFPLDSDDIRKSSEQWLNLMYEKMGTRGLLPHAEIEKEKRLDKNDSYSKVVREKIKETRLRVLEEFVEFILPDDG